MSPLGLVALLSILNFSMGLSRLPWWTAGLWPAVSIGLGIYATANEPPEYDMPGLGLYFGLFVAVFCAAAWLLGRGLRVLGRHRREPPDHSLSD
jgi:hypothetical protein